MCVTGHVREGLGGGVGDDRASWRRLEPKNRQRQDGVAGAIAGKFTVSGEES
jgi:hypothetical protein